jgi:outer membrane biosynthesis protein TonB
MLRAWFIDHSLNLGIAGSVIIHGLILAVWNASPEFPRQLSHFKEIKISYKQRSSRNNPPINYVETPKIDLPSSKNPDIQPQRFKTTKFMTSNSFIEPNLFEKPRQQSPDRFDHHVRGAIQIPDIKRTLVTPEINSEKISNPEYLNYNQQIQRRIQRMAFKVANDYPKAAGVVRIKFVVNSQGDVIQHKFDQIDPAHNELLKTIVLEILEESEPFPVFPKDLSFPVLSFQIQISFLH